MRPLERFITVSIVLALLIFAAFGLFAPDAVPPSVTLSLDKWECTAHDSRDGTRFIFVGKVAVPQHYTREVCIQYEERDVEN